jgi:hypothetical protein
VRNALVITAVLLALSVSGGATAGLALAPTLRMVTAHPLRVAAAHFKPHERVVVTFTGRTTVRTTARANATGSFRATFATVSLGRCERAAVRAVGRQGSTGVLKILPAPACLTY